MKLYVDAGNTRIKWIHDGMPKARVADSPQRLGAQWEALDSVRISQVTGSCVRGDELAAGLDQLAQACFGKKIGWMCSVSRARGVTNAYAKPENLGIDRWAALIAARALYPGEACIVVDAGTAITVDMLDATGLHRGGVILPGARSMLDTLGRAEQLFPDASRDLHQLAGSAQALADNTQEAVLAGIIFAVQGGVSAVIAQQARQINVKIGTIPIILTGGDSPMLKLDGLSAFSVPDLVLHGLRLLTGHPQ